MFPVLSFISCITSGKSDSLSEALASCIRMVVLVVKNLPANAGDRRDTRSIPGLGNPLEEDLAPPSSVLDWKIPWTEDAGRLQPMGLWRIRQD